MTAPRWIRGWAAILAVCSFACDSPPAADGAKDGPPTDETVVLRLEPYVGRLVTVRPALGRDTLRMLFDTGAGETLLSPSLAEGAGCVPDGRSVGFRMSGERVEWPMCRDLELHFNGERIVDSAFGVWDVMSVLPEELPRLDGVASLETFRDRLLTLDLSGGRLVLETEASFRRRTRRMDPVPARIATGTDGRHLTLFVRGTLTGTGREVWFLVDSANLSDVILGLHAADGVPSSEAEIALGDSLVVTASVTSADIIYDGALSEAFLRQIVLSVDLEAGRAWVTRADASSEDAS